MPARPGVPGPAPRKGFFSLSAYRRPRVGDGGSGFGNAPGVSVRNVAALVVSRGWPHVPFGRFRHWRGARRADRRLPAHQAGHLHHGDRGRSDLRRRHQPHRQLQGFPVRHRRTPLLLQVQGGGRPVAGDPARRLHRAPAAVAHLLQRPVLLLPAQGLRGPEQPGLRRIGAVRAVVPAEAGLPHGQARELPRLGGQPVRRAAVQHLLQDLHREGVGHELRRDLGRLGGAAHQGPGLVERHVERAAQLDAARRDAEKGRPADQDADRDRSSIRARAPA